MNKKSSSTGIPVSPEKQQELNAVFNALTSNGQNLPGPDKNEIKYFAKVAEHMNHQITQWGIPLADPANEIESRSFDFKLPLDLSIAPESVADIFVSEILVGWKNIKEFTVTGLYGIRGPDNIAVLLKAKWELK